VQIIIPNTGEILMIGVVRIIKHNLGVPDLLHGVLLKHLE